MVQLTSEELAELVKILNSAKKDLNSSKAFINRKELENRIQTINDILSKLSE